MKHKFRNGESVICVNTLALDNELTIGKIYIVEDIDDGYVVLQDVDGCWCIWRFEHIDYDIGL